ncbi:MAG TPA: type II toxin-antitoxin system RelE/ParE family toxin [Noviherbaspirillum sp.]|nr:type II toxin-antitoxin system RelE/ParE family toxin [Noviherbaspirillum sp.]
MTRKSVVKLTANFERNLESIDQFLLEAEATHAFDALLDELTETIIPNLEHFPDIGRPFLDRPARSVEAANGVAAVRKQLEIITNAGDLREYIFTDYLVLYASCGDTVYLLSIKHHRQLSFDLQSLWLAP